VIHKRNDEHNGKVVQLISEEWARLIQFCQKLGYGEIEKLKIHDGVPVIADVVREKVKFT
jgi:ribosomal protein S12 methylthiotransferase accessory factor YcaO